MRLAYVLCAVVVGGMGSWAGDLTKRFELTLERVLHGGPPGYTDDFVLADVVPRPERRFTEYSGDLSGRYLGALAYATTLTGKSYSELDRKLTALLALQKPEGYFGSLASTNQDALPDLALVWGNGRLLVGLVEYHQINPQATVREAAQRLGDFLLSLEPKFAPEAVREALLADRGRYHYWTQAIEGLVGLHRLSSEARYLEGATRLAAGVARRPGQHSHALLTSLRGVLELYDRGRDAQHLAQVERLWQELVTAGEVLAWGAPPEFLGASDRREEGCSTADWLWLNLGLWAQTRQLKYLEEAERTLLNAFYFNQFHTGDFGHRQNEPRGAGPPVARAWWCCTLHGLRTFPVVHAAAFHRADNVLYYDLPVDGEGRLDGLVLSADARLEQTGTVLLRVRDAATAPQRLAVRQPGWASAVQINVGGVNLAGELKDGYLHVQRPWKAGERVTIAYRMGTRVVRHPQHPDWLAFLHGPWFIGVNEVASPNFFDEPAERNRVRLIAPGEGGEVWLDPDPPGVRDSGRFRIPQGHRKVRYLPGGYSVQTQTALLRPLAEQTALPDPTAWLFWFEADFGP